MTLRPLSRWLLPASLAFNLFLAGLVVGQLQGRGFGPPPPPPQPGRMVEEMASTLPGPDADVLRAAFAANAAVLDRGHHARNAMHGDIRRILAAPDFDPQALKAVFDRGRQERETLDDALGSAIITAASRMSAEGRRKLGEWAPPGRPPPPPG